MQDVRFWMWDEEMERLNWKKIMQTAKLMGVTWCPGKICPDHTKAKPLSAVPRECVLRLISSIRRVGGFMNIQAMLLRMWKPIRKLVQKEHILTRKWNSNLISGFGNWNMSSADELFRLVVKKYWLSYL